MNKNLYIKHKNVNFFFVNNYESYIEDFFANQAMREAFVATNYTFYSTFIPNIILHTINCGSKKINQSIAEWVSSFLSQRFAKNFKKDEKDEIKRLSKILGMKEEALGNAFVSADVFNYLIAITGRLKRFIPNFIAGGCSTITVSPPQSDTFLIGRNLDFTGIDFSDREHALYVFNLKKNIPYIVISSLGATIPLNAINREGIFIGIHFLYSKHASRRGTPIYSILNECIKNVHTIEEAINFLKKCSFAGSWTIVIASAKENKTCACEVNAKGFSVVLPEERYFYYANCYQSENLKSAEVIPSQALTEHNLFRTERAKEYFHVLSHVTEEHIALFLGDHYDVYTKRIRPFGNAIAALHNLSSMVLAPNIGKLWMSNRRAPACDTEEYHGFDIGALYNNEIHDIPSILVETKKIPKGIEAYKKAHVAWFNFHDSREASLHLKEAIAENPDEPIYKFVLGLFLLKNKKYKESELLFHECLMIPDSPVRVKQYIQYLEKAKKKRSRGIHINTILGEAL